MEEGNAIAYTAHVPTEILEHILAYAHDYYPVIRTVCKRWCAAVPPRDRRLPTSFDFLSSVALLEWVYARHNPTTGVFHAWIRAAARGNHFAAIVWLDGHAPAQRGTHWKHMEMVLDVAAQHNNLDMMRLAKTLGASDFQRALRAAALGRREDAMRLARDWGAPDLEEVADILNEMGITLL